MGRSGDRYGSESSPPPIDAVIAAVATERHAVLSTAELADLGLSDRQRRYRARTGRLHRLYPGVFAVGHTSLSLQGRWRAAVLACGPEAALSHRDAAMLWGIRRSSRGRVDVTTPRRSRVGHAGIDLHRVRSLDAQDLTEHDHIRVTTVARTLVDLTDVLDDRGLRKAVHESEVLRLLDVTDVLYACARANGRRNIKALLAVIDAPAPATRSELEDRFLALVDEGGLPRPQTNVPIGPYEVDFFWADHGLVVETDGAAVHHTRQAFEDDRAKDAYLATLGLTVVRFTWRQITERPREVVATLRTLMSR